MEERQDTQERNFERVKPRCVNLDWLEVFCLEPICSTRDAEYFRERGFIVEEREYGTRIYNQMFTLFGTDNYPLLEIRRSPKSSQPNGGLLPMNACHVRLVNRTCYYYDAAQKLKAFLIEHGLEYQRISRVDVCLDFERFDSGDWPQKFLRRYLQEKFAKINQTRIANYGEDAWTTRRWDSISWGREKSDVTTKLYNKTKQLNEVKDKPYIKQAWFACGLIDNPVTCERRSAKGVVYKPDIWRVEFSVRSGVKGWFVIEPNGKVNKKQSIRNNLDVWSGRENLLAMFASLAQHYFRFKIVEIGKRKDLCKDKVLFRWTANETFYKVEKLASPSDKRKDLERLLSALNNYAATHNEEEFKNAIRVIVKAIDEDQARRFLEHPYSRVELQALQQAIAYRIKHKDIDPALLVQQFKQFLTETPTKVW